MCDPPGAGPQALSALNRRRAVDPATLPPIKRRGGRAAGAGCMKPRSPDAGRLGVGSHPGVVGFGGRFMLLPMGMSRYYSFTDYPMLEPADL
jgi:hypothetical protein